MIIKLEQEDGELDNQFWKVEQFYQENNIEILNIIADDKEDEEIFETMRIYIERVYHINIEWKTFQLFRR
jgi:hypothetical protein